MPIRKGKAATVTFALIDTASRPARKAALTFSAGDFKISKDGAAFANTTNLPTEISSGRYKVVLTATETACDWLHLYSTKTGADNMDLIFPTSGHPTALVVADGSNSTTTFKTDRAETAPDYWKDSLIVFTSGSLIEQVRKVTAYNGTTKFVTVSSAFTAAPSASDRFDFVNI